MFDKDRDEDEGAVKRDWATVVDDGSVVVTLQRPIVQKGGDVGTLTLRRPTAGDLESSDKGSGNVAGTNLLIASLSGLPVGVVRRLDVVDFRRCNEIITEWIEGKA